MSKSALKKLKYFEIFIVNLITLIRLIGAFTLPFIYHHSGPSVVSFYIILLFLTDAVDGFLARTLKVSTFFGSFMDAFSDKLLNTISFIILGLEYNIMFAPLIIEISILYTSYSTYRYGGNVKTSMIGKLKTIILDVLVISSFILLSLPNIVNKPIIVINLIEKTNIIIHIFALVIIIFCLLTLYDYMNKNKIARKNPKCIEIKNEQRNRKPIKMIISHLFDTEYYKKHKNKSIMKQLYFE